MIDAVYTNDVALIENTPVQAESLLHSLKKAVRGTGFKVDANRIEFMWFKQKSDISTLNGQPLNL